MFKERGLEHVIKVNYALRLLGDIKGALVCVVLSVSFYGHAHLLLILHCNKAKVKTAG